jgi:hypothetical protein
MTRLSLLFAALSLLASLHAQAQVFVQGHNLNEMDLVYISVKPTFEAKLFSPVKLMVDVDYGQERKNNDQFFIHNASGQTIIFNSIVHVLNFMHRHNWELVTTDSALVMDRRILFRRRVEPDNMGLQKRNY